MPKKISLGGGISDLIITGVLLIAGALLVAQGILVFLYFDNTTDTYFENLSDTKTRSTKVLYNICLMLGGAGLSALIFCGHNLLAKVSNKISDKIFNTIVYVGSIVAAGYIWYLIPGKISTQADDIDGAELKDIVNASSIATVLVGYFAGSILFSNLKTITSNITGKQPEVIAQLVGTEIVIVSVLILTQAICFAILYFIGDDRVSGVRYWGVFTLTGIVGLLGVVLGVLLAIF